MRGNILLLVDDPEVSPIGSSQFRFCQPHSTFSRSGSYLASVLSPTSKHNQEETKTTMVGSLMIGRGGYLLGYNFSIYLLNALLGVSWRYGSMRCCFSGH